MQYDLHINNIMEGYGGGEQTALIYQQKKNDDILINGKNYIRPKSVNAVAF